MNLFDEFSMKFLTNFLTNFLTIFLTIFSSLQLVSRGKIHVFKYLEIQAIKEDRKRGVLTDGDYRRSYRKTTAQLNDFRLVESKRSDDNFDIFTLTCT